MRYILNLRSQIFLRYIYKLHANLTDSRDSLLLPTHHFTPVYIQSPLTREEKASEEGPRIIRELKHPRGSDAGKERERERVALAGIADPQFTGPFFVPAVPGRDGWITRKLFRSERLVAFTLRRNVPHNSLACRFLFALALGPFRAIESNTFRRRKNIALSNARRDYNETTASLVLRSPPWCISRIVLHIVARVSCPGSTNTDRRWISCDRLSLGSRPRRARDARSFIIAHGIY